MSSTNRGDFTSSPPIQMAFVYFSCLVALGRPSSTMGIDVVKPPPLSCSWSYLSPLSVMLAMGFSYVVFIAEELILVC